MRSMNLSCPLRQPVLWSLAFMGPSGSNDQISGSTFAWIDWADLDVIAPSRDFRADLAQVDPVDSSRIQASVNGQNDLKPYINSENGLEVRLEAWAKAPATNRDVEATLVVVLLRDCS